MIFSLLAVVFSYILSVRFLWAVGMALFIMWADNIVTAVSKPADKKEDSEGGDKDG